MNAGGIDRRWGIAIGEDDEAVVVVSLFGGEEIVEEGLETGAATTVDFDAGA